MRPLRIFLGWALAAAICLSLAAVILPAQAAFCDVAPGSWYEGAVTQLAQAGALTGYPDGTFRPGQPISAAEFVVIAVRLAGLPEAQGQTAHWAAGKMQAALQAGWYDWDEIPPTGERFDRPISRQLAVKILMRALLPDARGDYVTESAKIIDFASLDGRYYEAVQAAYASDVVHGDPDGAFNPLGSLTRAEACTLFRNLLRNTGAGQTSQPPAYSPPIPEPVQARRGGVSQNGWLQVIGTQLCSETGESVTLRGMSSHGLQWYGQFASAGAVSSLADCGANLFRAAMYTGEGGYLSQPEAMKTRLTAAVDAAIENDLYVIIDWHILSDGDPMAHVEEAEAFFPEMARRYRDTPNVLYEICNEPNGNVSWGGSGGVFLEESKVWLDFLDARGISWCNWSLCDKGETSAALRPGASPEGPWEHEELTQSGKFVFSRFSQ